jgi:hypothetical protein
MSPTHLPPPHHFNIHLMQSSHPEDGGSTFLQHDEHLTTTQNRNKSKTVISSMHTFRPYISYCTCTSVSTNLTTAHTTFVLHALTLFTTKPTVSTMQWCTHFGNLTNTLFLIPHLVLCVIVRSHIHNDRLLIWMGLVHVWNRGLLFSLLLSDNTIQGAHLKYCLLYQIKS